MFDVISHRVHVDNSMEAIGKLLFGSDQSLETLKTVRPSGQPLVDDWDCLKSMVCTLCTENSCHSVSSKCNILKKGLRCPNHPTAILSLLSIEHALTNTLLLDYYQYNHKKLFFQDFFKLLSPS